MLYNENSQADNFQADTQINNMHSFAGLRSGIIWFITFLPLLGLFLENYCVSKWAGLYLWALIVIMLVVCCFIDCRAITKLGADTDKLSKWIWLAPVYVFKRERLCFRDINKSIMLGFFIAAALVMNGFTQGIRINENSLPIIVQNSSVQNLENFSGTSANVIGEMLSAYLGTDAEWDCTKDGEEFYITCTGKNGSDTYTVTFDINFDGFAYQGNRVFSIEKNGKQLEGDDYKAALTEIFIPEANEDNSSSQQ